MSWNGNDNKDPWDRNNGPPDIDEAIKKFKDRLNSILGGGSPGGGGSVGSGSLGGVGSGGSVTIGVSSGLNGGIPVVGVFGGIKHTSSPVSVFITHTRSSGA